MEEDNWKIDGKVFSIGELSEIIERELEFGDEINFSFSGNYNTLKKHIEEFAGVEMGDKYKVNRIMNVFNFGDRLEIRGYTVIVKKLPPPNSIK